MGKWSEDWLMAFGLLMDKAATWDWLNILLIGGAFLSLILLVIAQFTPGDGFDMRSMVATRKLDANGRDYWTVESGRCFQTGAFGVTTWGFVWVTTHDKLTELYLLVYVVLWAGSRAMNQIVASKFPAQPGTVIAEEPPSPSVTTTTTTEVKT